MMIPFDKASELYLSTLETEGKSPRYIAWLKTRLRFFDDYLKRTYGEGFKLQDLTVEEGRRYIRADGAGYPLPDHPMHKVKKASSRFNISMV
jgi:hypothetical protein